MQNFWCKKIFYIISSKITPQCRIYFCNPQGEKPGEISVHPKTTVSLVQLHFKIYIVNISMINENYLFISIVNRQNGTLAPN